MISKKIGKYLRNLNNTRGKPLVRIERASGFEQLYITVEKGVLNPVSLTKGRNADGGNNCKLLINESGVMWLEFASENNYIEFIEHFTPLQFIKFDEETGEAIFVDPNSLSIGDISSLTWEVDYQSI